VTVRLEGAPVAEYLHRASRTAVEQRGNRSRPSLVSVHRGVESSFRFYLRRQAKAAAELGIDFRDDPLPVGDGPKGLTDRIRALDRDPAVHGVLVEHPLPAPFDFLRSVEALRPEKDVDGVGPRNLGLLAAQRPVHVPAVAAAALDIARHYELPVAGARVAVIGRSETVGRPLALLLSARPPGGNATVTIVHSQSPDLRSCLAGVQTIFSCVGRPGLLDRSVVPEGAHVVDVGLSSVPDPSRPSGVRAVGDADASALEGWAGSLTPVPGGVGPVTVAELMASTVRAWQSLAGRAGTP
jgi:methylenetetrahydrofolate dehydrogenase (NADP+)/methenyltetrahydrofolate cyclohydrolase